MSTLDFRKEVKDTPVYPEGTYKVTVDSYERTEAKTGTKQVRFRASILEPVEHQGRQIVEHCALTDKALWKIANLIHACGIDTAKLPVVETGSPAFDSVLKACIGKKAYWRLVVTKDKSGNDKNDVVNYKLDPDNAVQEISIDEDAPDFAKKEIKWDA